MSDLLYRDAPREASGLLYVAPSADGYMIGEELERDDFEDRSHVLAATIWSHLMQCFPANNGVSAWA